MLVYLVASVSLGSAGFEHNLYNYASVPAVPLSDMNGMSRFWVGAAWYQFYWSAFATGLAVLAHGLWRRGTADALRPRLAALPRRLRGPAGVIGGGAAVLWLASGAWIFWNTNVLNQYLPAPERDQLLADAEKALLPFEKLPQPSITHVMLDVQLFPRDARVVTRGIYRVENRSAQPIDELHVGWGERLKIDELALAGAELQKSYERFNHRIYRLQPALQPGEAREMRFSTTLAQQGFADGASLGGLQQTAEGRPLTRVVDNGSFIDNSEISPFIGFSRQGLLTDRAKRRKYGLPPDLRPPKLEDESGRQKSEFRADGDWVTADITVSTDADQTPIAPGTLLSDTTGGGRRTAHFKADAPINHFFSIQSARYEVRRDKLGDIDLAVYYHPGHDVNVDRMIKAMKASLALFGEQFSPYQFKQARILEFPSYASFAQSFANTIPYSEDIGFLSRLAEPEQIDVVTFVTAHEIAHQWWGHQLVPSEQQGASMLVESFAQYSALLVMERIYGKEQMRRFLKYELDRYLRRRGGEVVEELPLARVEEQTYIHYQKGALTMYWLKEVVGEAVVNRALSRLLKQFAFKSAPYPNSTDFLRILREEAGAQHEPLITDLFERITLLDVKGANAKATKRADGKWDLSFEVEARKLYADGKGQETEAPLNEPFDIGVFTVEPGRKGYSATSILSFERQNIRTGKQTVRLVVDQEPKFVGVDPFNKRIDRNSEDNITRVDGG
jgi:aminopeptidase N